MPTLNIGADVILNETKLLSWRGKTEFGKSINPTNTKGIVLSISEPRHGSDGEKVYQVQWDGSGRVKKKYLYGARITTIICAHLFRGTPMTNTLKVGALKVGAIVQINPEKINELRGLHASWGPFNTCGTVTEINPGRIQAFTVLWGTGEKNDYEPHELTIVTPIILEAQI